jgi:hypothetical protein
MGENVVRTSAAHEIVEKALKARERREMYIVAYDFKGSRSVPRFYNNLAIVLSKLGGKLIQRSVVQTRSLRCALAVNALADRYGAKVECFKASPLR